MMAHPDEWVMLMSWPRPPLTLNQRMHWAKKAQLSRMVRDEVAWRARAARIPLLDFATVQLVWVVNDRRARDEDNLVATGKPCLDGLVDAGVVVDDNTRYVRQEMPRIIRLAETKNWDKTGVYVHVINGGKQ